MLSGLAGAVTVGAGLMISPASGWGQDRHWQDPATFPGLTVFGQYGDPRFEGAETMRRLALIVETVAGRAGVAVQFATMPLNRSYQTMTRTANGCIGAIARLPERQAEAVWLFPIRETRVVAVTRRDGPVGPVTVERLRQDSDAGIVSLDGIGQVLLQDRGIRHDSRPAIDTVVRMVTAGRVRYGVMMQVSYDLLPAADREELRVAGVLSDESLWMACGVGTDPARVVAMRQGYGAVHGDGTLAALYRSFGSPMPAYPTSFDAPPGLAATPGGPAR